MAAPEGVVFTKLFEPFPDAESVMTSLLTEEGGKTRLTATVTYPSVQVRDMVIKSGMAKGAGISYDRLEEVARELARALAASILFRDCVESGRDPTLIAVATSLGKGNGRELDRALEERD
jgi:hypothetical protein